MWCRLIRAHSDCCPRNKLNPTAISEQVMSAPSSLQILRNGKLPTLKNEYYRINNRRTGILQIYLIIQFSNTLCIFILKIILINYSWYSLGIEKRNEILGTANSHFSRNVKCTIKSSESLWNHKKRYLPLTLTDYLSH